MRTKAKDLSPIQLTAAIIGVVFLLVGLAGFVPGLTTGYDGIEGSGHESHAMLFGVFQVSVLHNIVHLLFGVVGLAVAMTTIGNTYWYLVGGGAVYLVLWLYGMVIDPESRANFVPVNDADNWLHLILGLLMVGLGVLLRGKSRLDVKRMTR